jgi:hypothetical protein
LPSQCFQFKGILISKVEFLLVFFMNYHQRDSLDAFFFQGSFNGIEKHNLIVAFGIVDLRVFAPVVLVEISESLNGVAHAIQPNRHEVEFDEFWLFVTHVVDSDTGDSVVFMVDVFVVELEELADEGVGVGGLLEHLVDELFVFGDLQDQFHPNHVRP